MKNKLNARELKFRARQQVIAKFRNGLDNLWKKEKESAVEVLVKKVTK